MTAPRRIAAILITAGLTVAGLCAGVRAVPGTVHPAAARTAVLADSGSPVRQGEIDWP